MRAIIFAALLLTACGGNAAREELPPPPLPERTGVDETVAARAEQIEFRAVADGIVVDIFRTDRIRLTRTATREELIFPKPEPQYPRWNGSIYRTSANGRSLRVEIHNNSDCDTPGGFADLDRVVIVLDGQETEACGRAF
jgi:hypothetical protein